MCFGQPERVIDHFTSNHHLQRLLPLHLCLLLHDCDYAEHDCLSALRSALSWCQLVLGSVPEQTREMLEPVSTRPWQEVSSRSVHIVHALDLARQAAAVRI